jgi:hypothetical protein
LVPWRSVRRAVEWSGSNLDPDPELLLFRPLSPPRNLCEVAN